MNVKLSFSSYMITEEEVIKALNSLIYSAVKRVNTDLDGLFLIDKFLDSIKWQGHEIERGRRYGLQCVLIQAISRRFMHVATLFGLDVDGEENYEQAIKSIASYGKIYNPELSGWAWLHYRFVRVDLCISAPEFSEAHCINERTLRRYQTHAISRLTDLLIEQESQARLIAGI
jgi:hypothetical protein